MIKYLLLLFLPFVSGAQKHLQFVDVYRSIVVSATPISQTFRLGNLYYGHKDDYQCLWTFGVERVLCQGDDGKKVAHYTGVMAAHFFWDNRNERSNIFPVAGFSCSSNLSLDAGAGYRIGCVALYLTTQFKVVGNSPNSFAALSFSFTPKLWGGW